MVCWDMYTGSEIWRKAGGIQGSSRSSSCLGMEIATSTWSKDRVGMASSARPAHVTYSQHVPTHARICNQYTNFCEYMSSARSIMRW
ncbi:hypothetical protein SCLCIDRAFT_1218749 [Scleroderma citrinum Foug A]|uniref:Uncharacterized protein n=1 Tax=Scleroderma citrinum Foug A TaxID=1036808 RepID=A0A0C3DQB1_9AGAM|nr:hypothetical protein SCLCIDRAFT_1218749 [Scleroderma citrinum Foug A]